MSDTRPRRSVLYMPSSNERALEKAKAIACDGLILDLEDAVAPDAKPAAREAACAAAASGDYGRRTVTIRVNGIGTEWHGADLAAASQAGPDAVVELDRELDRSHALEVLRVERRPRAGRHLRGDSGDAGNGLDRVAEQVAVVQLVAAAERSRGLAQLRVDEGVDDHRRPTLRAVERDP